MAHNITERDGVFAVREPMWHGLGDILPEYPTREQAQKIAHPWEPVTEPVYRRVPVMTDDGPDYEYTQIDGFQAIVRDDDLTASGALGVQSSTYEPVRNGEMYDIAEAIEGEAKGSVMYETGGSLKGGRKVWLLIRLRDPIKIAGDPHGDAIPYFAIQNAHDGSGSFRGQGLFTRIVCDNTAHAADMEATARGTEFAFSHTRNVSDRIEEAKAALAGWRDSIDKYQRRMELLLDTPVTERQRRWFIEEFIPMPPPTLASKRVQENVLLAQFQLHSLFASETLEGVGLTSYGLVQGAIEYNQHVRQAQTKESRFKRAYLDRSTIAADALALAEQAALV